MHFNWWCLAWLLVPLSHEKLCPSALLSPNVLALCWGTHSTDGQQKVKIARTPAISLLFSQDKNLNYLSAFSAPALTGTLSPSCLRLDLMLISLCQMALSVSFDLKHTFLTSKAGLNHFSSSPPADHFKYKMFFSWGTRSSLVKCCLCYDLKWEEKYLNTIELNAKSCASHESE